MKTQTLPGTGLAIFVALSLGLPEPASARNFRVDQIPNGSRYGCQSCHETAAGGGVFTPFGSASISALVEGALPQQADLVWSELAQLDSDRDGFSNGVELGDPDGTWTIGARSPAAITFNPGVRDQHPPAVCGDGGVTPPEECDGSNVGFDTCERLDLGGGTLGCLSNCRFDKTGCDDYAPEDVGTGRSPFDLDAGSGGEDEGGCATSAPVSPGWSLLLFGLVGLGRRRERVVGRG